MKRVKIAAILLAFLMVVLTACSAAPTGGASGQADVTPATDTNLDPANPTTVTLWHYYVDENQQVLEAAAAEFNQTIGMETGVIIEVVAKGDISELEEAVTNSAMGVINSEPMPAIFSSYPDKAMEIDELGMLVDLNEYFTEEEQQLYVSSFLEDGIFSEGRLLLVPIVKSTELMFVNATAWNEFAQSEGYSEQDLVTWEGVYNTARAYYQWTDAQTPDVAWDGTGLIGFDSVANFIIIGNKQLGVDIIDGEGQQAMLDQETLSYIFASYYSGMSLGYFDAAGRFRSDDIKSGDLIAYVGSSSSAAYFPTWLESDNTQQDIDFMALPYPYFENGTAYAVQQGAGMCVARTTPEQQEGAAMFLKWFTAPQQNIQFAMTTGYLPVQSAAYESEDMDAEIQTLREGEVAQQNVASVYEIALHQIIEADTYAASPFAGSYDVRSIVQSTLIDMGLAGQQEADALKAQGLSEEEILAALDVNAAFEQWMVNIRAELDALDISYTG